MSTTGTQFGTGQHVWTLTAGGRDRHAVVHVPEKGVAPRAAVIMLHGAGASTAWTMRETRWTELANLEGFVVVFPEATRRMPDEPVRFFTNPPAWNDGSAYPPGSWATADDAGFLAKVIDELPAAAGVDPRRLFLTGFSNGAGMAFRMAVDAGDRIAAVAPIAGHPAVWPKAAVHAVPTLFMVGTDDPLVPFESRTIDTPWAKGVVKPSLRTSLSRWCDHLSCNREPRWVQQIDGVLVEHYGPGRKDSVLEVWLIDGLGHHWPGGRGELSQRLAGSPSDRVNANESVWRFFKQFTLR